MTKVTEVTNFLHNVSRIWKNSIFNEFYTKITTRVKNFYLLGNSVTLVTSVTWQDFD